MTTTPRPVPPVEHLDHVRGAKEPLITVIEYGDYDCPHTRAAQAIVDRLGRENVDLRIVFRPFPLRDIHANAEILARVASAASLQGRFWEMHDHLMRHHRAVDQSGVLRDAEDTGVDLVRLEGDVMDPSVIAGIEDHLEAGRRSGVHSTPTFFFNGDKHDGHYDYETLTDRLQAVRSPSGGGRPRAG